VHPYSDLCRVLEEDADLIEALPMAQRQAATRACLAPCLSIPMGDWQAAQLAPRGDGIGLLVIHGLLLRRVGVEGRFGAELLGAGDLLRPWQGEDEPSTLPVSTCWRVIERARLAILDQRFLHRSLRYPALNSRLVARALNRARGLAVNMAIVHQPRVDVRLKMLLWHLAARWGKVTSDGVLLPLRLTHSVLAELVAARRPTVSGALAEMGRQGIVIQVDGGWRLAGPPPSELVDLTPVVSLMNAEAQTERPLASSETTR
jgi:CRP/FNR family transcriptional regulator, cyclic AMP receptor protein